MTSPSLKPSLSARIVARHRMLYREGADAALDRPAHVRAASGISWFDGELAVVQDDAHVIALVDPRTGQATAVALPADREGKRLFDDTRGTKHLKLDLEACFARSTASHSELFALGSGSKPLRERIAVLRRDWASRAISDIRVVDASTLYKSFREVAEFSGSELNLEGAVVRDDSLLLFQRGNGAASEGRSPISAIGQLSLSAFVAYVESDGTGAVPRLQRVRPYDLGSIAGVPYTFTDAALSASGAIVFLASAEDSTSAVTDGAVHGTLIGELEEQGVLRSAALFDERGAPARIKAEGIALDPSDATRAYIVVDMDDPTLASELLEVALSP
jgi:hypothetical protein